MKRASASDTARPSAASNWADLDCHWVLLGGDAFHVPENAHRLSGVDVGGAGAGRELTVGSAGAAPVVVRDEVGAVTVVEIGLVEPYTSAATTVAEMAAIIQGHGVPPLLVRLSRLGHDVSWVKA